MVAADRAALPTSPGGLSAWLVDGGRPGRSGRADRETARAGDPPGPRDRTALARRLLPGHGGRGPGGHRPGRGGQGGPGPPGRRDHGPPHRRARACCAGGTISNRTAPSSRCPPPTGSSSGPAPSCWWSAPGASIRSRPLAGTAERFIGSGGSAAARRAPRVAEGRRRAPPGGRGHRGHPPTALLPSWTSPPSPIWSISATSSTWARRSTGTLDRRPDGQPPERAGAGRGPPPHPGGGRGPGRRRPGAAHRAAGARVEGPLRRPGRLRRRRRATGAGCWGSGP